MKLSNFPINDKSILITKIQHYLQTELECEVGQFDTDFFVDFLAKELGGYYYNQGIQDAQAILSSKIDDINEAISELEQVM